MLSCVAMATTGCADLFNLEPVTYEPTTTPGVIEPVQQVAVQYARDGVDQSVVRVLDVEPTLPGNALVLVALLTTSSYEISSITDDGGNSWARVIAGEDPANSADIRLEVWRSGGAESASSVSLTLENDRSLRLFFVEWPVTGAALAAAGGLFATSAAPTIGPLPLGQQALLMSTLAYRHPAPPVADDPEAIALLPSRLGSEAIGVWYRVVEAGSHSESWTFPIDAPSVAGLVALTTD